MVRALHVQLGDQGSDPGFLFRRFKIRTVGFGHLRPRGPEVLQLERVSVGALRPQYGVFPLIVRCSLLLYSRAARGLPTLRFCGLCRHDDTRRRLALLLSFRLKPPETYFSTRRATHRRPGPKPQCNLHSELKTPKPKTLATRS